MRNQTFEFPVGYHKLHRTKIMDYQLNRWYSLGYIRLEPLREAARRIRSLEDWKPEMVRQAEKAVKDQFVPFGMQLQMHRRQVKALTNARSVTERIFTAADQAENHCQVGNFGLALREMAEWIAVHEKTN